MPKRDPRYKVIHLLIKYEKIQVFSQIVDYIPKSVLAKQLRTNSNRLTRFLKDPFEFKLAELNKIARLLNTPLDKVVSLAIEQKKRVKSSQKIHESLTKKKRETLHKKLNRRI